MISVQALWKKAGELSNKQRSILTYMLNNPDDVRRLSLREFAARANASEVSVLKVCRALGFDGFAALRKEFSSRGDEEFYSNQEIETLVRCGGSEMREEERRYLFGMVRETCMRNLSRIINETDPGEILACGRILMEAREVFIFGYNASQTLSDYLAHRLNYLRIKARAVKLADNDTVQTVLARLDSTDVAVFFSFPPYYLPTADVVRFAAIRGAGIIAITDNAASPAIAPGSRNYFCKTSIPFFYNAMSVPMAFIELLVSGIAIQMAEGFDRIIRDELQVSQYFDGKDAKDLV